MPEATFERWKYDLAQQLVEPRVPGQTLLSAIFADPSFTEEDLHPLFVAWLEDIPKEHLTEPGKAGALLFAQQVLDDDWDVMVDQVIAGRCSMSVVGTLVRLIEFAEPFNIHYAALAFPPTFPLALVAEMAENQNLKVWAGELLVSRANQEIPEFRGSPEDLIVSLAGALEVPDEWYENVVWLPEKDSTDGQA